MADDPTQQLEGVAAQAPGQLGQALQNQQNQPAPVAPAAPDPVADGLDQAAQHYSQQLQENATRPAQGGAIKRLLSNFIGGMGQSMMQEAGLPTPYEKQKQAIQGLQAVAEAKSHLATVQSLQAQSAPVPLIGIDDQPVTGSDGKPIMLPANHAATIYAARLNAASRVQIQGMKGDTAETVQGMKNQANPIQNLLGEAAQAYSNGDTDTYNAKLKELSQLQGTKTSEQREDKLSMFHQSQEYQTWKTTQDNKTKLQVAAMSQDKAPAAIMQTALFAQSGMNRLTDAQAAIQRLEQRGVLGTVASNKLEDWVFGKGLVDPTLPAQDRQDIGKLRAALTYTSSAAMRAHTGRSSREIYDDFKNTMGLNQSSEALKGAIEETGSMLNDYATGATNASIHALRGGSGSTPAPPSIQFKEGSDIYNIPADKVQAFKAKHPQAVPNGR